MAQPRWFARLGQPIDAPTLALARAYLSALGYEGNVGVAVVTQRAEAEAIARAPDWDTHWWQIENAERGRLQGLAEAALGRAELLERLSTITAEHNDPVRAAAERALAEDPALARAAAGAAALALHEQALARLAGARTDHLFMRKYALFAAGRWPLGVIHQTFHLY